jgi:hypothetical protein
VSHEGRPPLDSELGSRNRVVYISRDTNERVHQYVYPFARDEPMTHTPPGQTRGFWWVFGEREIRGWYEAPLPLVDLLIEKGLPMHHRLHREYRDTLPEPLALAKRFFPLESLLYSIFVGKFTPGLN